MTIPFDSKLKILVGIKAMGVDRKHSHDTPPDRIQNAGKNYIRAFVDHLLSNKSKFVLILADWVDCDNLI